MLSGIEAIHVISSILLQLYPEDLDIVIGVPAVRRLGEELYLFPTLYLLVQKGNELKRSMILVLVSDPDKEWVRNTTIILKALFANEMRRDVMRVSMLKGSHCYWRQVEQAKNKISYQALYYC